MLPVESTTLRMRPMGTGNGVTSSRSRRGGSPHRGGANRMRRERRMPEEAKAWGNAQDTLTSGRYSERYSHESEATSQYTGAIPDGGLARHPLEEGPSARLPPPKADLPSHALWSRQNSTQAPETVGEVMVCPAARGASCDPG